MIIARLEHTAAHRAQEARHILKLWPVPQKTNTERQPHALTPQFRITSLPNKHVDELWEQAHPCAKATADEDIETRNLTAVSLTYIRHVRPVTEGLVNVVMVLLTECRFV